MALIRSKCKLEAVDYGFLGLGYELENKIIRIQSPASVFKT